MAEVFGTDPDGTDVLRVAISNGDTTAQLMTWGASLQDLRLAGVDHPLVLGADSFAPYPDRLPHFGAIVGPIANRIADGRAPLEGQTIQLERNEDGATHLHGGTQGTSRVNWTLAEESATACRFTLTQPDGNGGLPGPVRLSVTYSLGADGALEVAITGEADRPTFCAPAHHAYWALDGGQSVARQRLTIAADHYLPIDGRKIPTGDPAPVEGTRFDFRASRAVIEPGDAPLDHNFCLRPGDGVRPVCTLATDAVELIVSSDQPGLQVYDAAHLDLTAGLGGRHYGPHAGLAIEPQRWPDGPNHPGYPAITLAPGETYRQTSRFHVRRLSS